MGEGSVLLGTLNGMPVANRTDVAAAPPTRDTGELTWCWAMPTSAGTDGQTLYVPYRTVGCSSSHFSGRKVRSKCPPLRRCGRRTEGAAAALIQGKELPALVRDRPVTVFMARAIWKGVLQLGESAVPVKLYSAAG
jgi:hypothetical protein